MGTRWQEDLKGELKVVYIINVIIVLLSRPYEDLKGELKQSSEAIITPCNACYVRISKENWSSFTNIMTVRFGKCIGGSQRRIEGGIHWGWRGFGIRSRISEENWRKTIDNTIINNALKRISEENWRQFTISHFGTLQLYRIWRISEENWRRQNLIKPSKLNKTPLGGSQRRIEGYPYTILSMVMHL